MSNENKLAWMAGLFEGDGHIGICRQASSKRKAGTDLYLQITVTNNDELLLAPFLVYGGKIISVSKTCISLRWYISTQNAVNFLKLIRPYLQGRKATQADLAIRFQSLIGSRKIRPTQENLQERIELYHKINELNYGKTTRK